MKMTLVPANSYQGGFGPNAEDPDAFRDKALFTQPEAHSRCMSPAAPYRIVLVDGQTLLRNVLAKAIRSDDRFELLAEAEDGVDAKEVCLRLLPDLVVMEADLPRLDGIELAQFLMRHSPEMRVLVLSHLKDPFTLNRIHEAGVHGYISKDEPLEILEEGMVEVASGRTYYPAAFCENQKRLREDPDAFSKILTPREQEILCYVASGMTSRSIADRLNLVARSVETYRYRMMRKLGVENVAGLIDYAFRHGFIRR